MSKLKYSNIQVPDIQIDEVDPLIYFSVVQCPHCAVILDSEKDIKVKRISSGNNCFHISTNVVANCKCPHCNTTFDVENTIASKFSIGLFVHTLLSILIIVTLILGIISGGICGICSIKFHDSIEAKILTKTLGCLTVIFFVVCFASVLGHSALETCNKDCIKHFNK